MWNRLSIQYIIFIIRKNRTSQRPFGRAASWTGCSKVRGEN